MEIKTRTQLIKALINKPLVEISKSEQKREVLDYLLENHKDCPPKTQESIVDYLLGNRKEIPEDYQEKVRDFLVEVTMVEARKSFYVYAKLMATTLLPNDFIDGRHIKKICTELQNIAESVEDNNRPTERGMFFLPPGAGKTNLCSILFPSWVFGKHPNWQVLAVGHGEDFAADKIGHPLRELMFSKEYRTIFPDTIIRADSKSKDRFVTTKKGEFKALGAKTKASGRRAHLLICDDMISEQDAWSKQKRTEINKNYIGGLRSRLTRTPRGAEIIVNTRYNLEDVSGYLLKVDEGAKRPWKIVKVPAILDEAGSAFMREPNDPPELFQPGSSFWPEMQPLELLEEERASLLKTEPHKWHALYMQDPTPQEGNIIKHSDWQDWDEDEPPKVTQVIVSMDTAFDNTKRADYSAYTVWGVFYPEINGPPHLILLEAKKGKWGWFELLDLCSEIKMRFKPDFFIVEKKGSGQVLLQDLYRKGYPLVEFEPRGSKEERLHSASVWWRMKRIWIPMHKSWAMEVLEEICNFPSAPNDDLVDSASQAVIWYRDMSTMEHTNDYHDDEDEDYDNQDIPNTYWKSLLGR